MVNHRCLIRASLGRRAGAYRSAAAVCLLVFTIGNLLLPQKAVRAQQFPTEYQVKAAYLFNFLKFVEWPDDVPAGLRAHWVIGILGNSPVGEELEQVAAGKMVQGREIQIRRLQSRDDPRLCHILFISGSEKNNVTHILGLLHGSSVLAVADTGQFLEWGGMIEFENEDNRIRLAINVAATSKARLKVSSKLLSLARSVTGGQSGGE